VVAMSGGVDSSVAAALLVEQGYEVVGIMMRLWAEQYLPAGCCSTALESDGTVPSEAGGPVLSTARGENRCCMPEAVEDARRVAHHLGIPFYLVNYEAEFRECVVDYFVAEYRRGRTPNPCLACNRYIRFGRLLRQARALDAAYLATGHYARVDRVHGHYRLRSGLDAQKDQSYVLYMLGQEELEQVLFPVGLYSKAEIREMARQRDLAVADKDESMEICFVADDDYRRFLLKHAPQAVRPGPILDTAGRQIGVHQGLPFYTVGQRRGLGIAAPEALYVIRLELDRNALVVGPLRQLGRRTLTAMDVSYVNGVHPSEPVRVQAKIRYKAALADATWTPLDGGQARVEFDRPLRDITPGQAVVAYQGDIVLGGGIISDSTDGEVS
jgi:tRNA-specific 2-thiouridylase